MEASEQIKKFGEFFDLVYRAAITENLRKGDKFLVADFAELIKFDHELAEQLLEDPDEVIRAAELAIEDSGLEGDLKKFKMRFKNLPKTQQIMIRNIRSNHIGKLFWTVGIVRQKSDVRPQAVVAKFECPACGNTISVPQLDKKFREPSRCSCGKKGRFKLLGKELVDVQGIVLEEAPEDLEGGDQPKRMQIFLQCDLVSPISEKRTGPGSKILVVGVIKEVPINLQTGGQSTRFDLLIEANYVEGVEEDFSDITISKDELKAIKEMADDPRIYTRLINSIAPSIYGHEKIKEALIMQLMGGVRKDRKDGVSIRGDIHILLIGDPGSGKCISGDSRIVLADGSVTTIEKSINGVLANETKIAEEYYKKTNHDLLSINLYGKVKVMKATAVWKRRAPDYLYRIRTYCGREITATAEHPFFITRNAMIMAKTASTLTEKDFIATPSKLGIKGSLQKICSDIRRTPARNGMHIKIPNVMNTDFARLIGYLIGDGHAYFTKTSAMISLTNNNDELLSDFSSLLSSLFGLKAVKRGARKGKTAKETYICSIELGLLLKQIDSGLFNRAKYKRIPDIIMKCPNNVLKEFIRAYFDCEAHIDTKERIIEIQSASDNLIDDIRIALLRFGIVSQVNAGLKCATNTAEKTMKKYWRLSISGEMVNTFYKKVGFVSKEKADKLKRIVDMRIKHNTNIHIIPCDGGLILSLRKLLKMTQKDFGISRSTYEHYEVCDRNSPKNNLLKITQAFEKRFVKIKDQLNEREKMFAHLKLKQLRLLCEADIFWDRVVGVERVKSGNEWVYDLQVDDVHNFIANNMFVHNSQMLKRVAKISPKGRYVSGKGVSGAGLTATVVKDEFLRGWSLEAGALVLANKGLCMIDELDKMSPEDRAAMHEALEQQCYLPDFEVMFADGSKKKIGLFVDSLIDENRNSILNGVNCEILSLDKEFKILTTDFEAIYPTRISKVSRHIAPPKFARIKLWNGREITVTPEHPCWAVKNGKIVTVPAASLKERDFFPIPGELSIDGEEQTFNLEPYSNGPELCKLIGYHISDGCYEVNRGKKNGIQFWNNDQKLINDYKGSIEKVFQLEPGTTKRGEQFAVRVVSKKVVDFFNSLDKNLMEKGRIKKIPEQIMKCKKEDLAFLVRALFDGEGTVVNVKRNGCRISLIAENAGLAEQVSEILLRFGIISSIYNDRDFFRVDICGQENLFKFYKNIGFLSDKKQNRLKSHLAKQKTYRSISDVIPNVSGSIRGIFGHLKMNQETDLGNQICVNCNKHRIFLQKIIKIIENRVEKIVDGKELVENTLNSGKLGAVRKSLGISALSISNKLGISDYMLVQNEKRNVADIRYQGILLHEIGDMMSILPQLREIKKLAFGKIRWVKIKSVEMLDNSDVRWVYDITVEPTHCFISNNMVLHNSVSISKANIQATLRAETTVLAAANPKFGRFEPYGDPIAKQIDLPTTLINRFDLIFAIKDLPQQDKDEKMAKFILGMHQNPDFEEAEIDTKLLRKYIAYARQNIRPKLSEGAMEEIQGYYLKMRASGSVEGEMRTIPISARQLEALVRLSEASAKIRLSNTVTKRDAKRAIDILNYCLTEIALDKETGRIDIDRISTGITSSERSKIAIIKEIIDALSEKSRQVAIQDVIDLAKEKAIDESEAEEVIERLKRSGDIFEPKPSLIQKI